MKRRKRWKGTLEPVPPEFNFPTEQQEKWLRIPTDGPLPGQDQVMEMLAELYEVYYRQDSDVARHRTDIETALGRLMMMYNAYLD